MTLSDFIFEAKNLLKQSSGNNFNLDCQVLICEVLKISKEEYFFKPDSIILNPDQIKSLNDAIFRRSNGEPVSKIINKKEFFGLDFFVNSQVLDPRPDSETLVLATIDIIKNFNIKPLIAEIGVGSGCLSVAIAKNCNNIKKIIATDISKESLAVCQKNISYHNLTELIQLVNCNLLNDISPDVKFDIIISNPPYIKTSHINKLQIDVRNFDPITALDGGDDGLNFYRNISTNAKNNLQEGGYLIFEIGFDQKNDVTRVLKNNDFDILRSVKDLAGNDRVIIAKKTI